MLEVELVLNSQSTSPVASKVEGPSEVLPVNDLCEL